MCAHTTTQPLCLQCCMRVRNALRVGSSQSTFIWSMCYTAEPRDIFEYIICECRVRSNNGLIVLLLRKCLGGSSFLWSYRNGTRILGKHQGPVCGNNTVVKLFLGQQLFSEPEHFYTNEFNLLH